MRLQVISIAIMLVFTSGFPSARANCAPRYTTPSVPTCRSGPFGVCTVDDTRSFSSSEQSRSRTVPSAQAVSKEAKTKAWWKAYPELWEEPKSREEFEKAIQDSNYDLVLVDWYATWCKGCERAFPEISRLATTDSMQGRVKFVKVCIDEMKAVSREQGVRVLPQITLFRPGHGRLLQFQSVPSKLKVAQKNIITMLNNPTKFFKLDLNGYVMVLDNDPAPQQAQAQQEAQKLKKSTGGLFDKLMASAGVSSTPPASLKNGTGSTNGAPTANGASTTNGAATNGAAAAANGNGPGTIARVPASEDSQAVVTGPLDPAAAAAEGANILMAKAEFLKEWGDSYGYGGKIDKLYTNEIGQRMAENEHYLDYTGSSLYCNSVLSSIFDDLKSHVFGNPHSANPSSSLTSERIDEARDVVLRFFNTNAQDYQVVFTKSATGGLQTTGETFPWSKGSVFRYTRENHNSVLGMREYALQHDARFQAVEEEWVEEWISGHKEDDHFVHPVAGTPEDPTYSLFAFPAEENFAGKKYPLRWIREIQGMSTKEHEWKVMLDAAAFAPTQPLDLTEFPADFVAVSFYKMFGFPTGLGALLVRTDNIEIMKKVFWGGGTVAIATSSDNFHVLKCKPSDKFEDGTVAFLDILSLPHVFNFSEGLGGINAIQAHVHSLTRHLYMRLAGLKHTNGQPLCEIFGRHQHPAPERVQGGIVNFEVKDPEGKIVSYKLVEQEAASAGFHIRTGIHCNPGAAYRDVGVSEKEVETLAGDKEGCGDDIDFIEVQRPVGSSQDKGIISDSDILPLMQGNTQLGHPGEVAMKWVKKPLGSVRASLGYMSTFEDVEAFSLFMERAYKDRPAV